MLEKWPKPFHDESDLSSEDVSLTDDTLRVVRPGRPKRHVWRLLGEVALAVSVLALAGIVIHDRVLPRNGLLPFGPVSKCDSVPIPYLPGVAVLLIALANSS